MAASPPSGELRRAQDPEVVRAHERDVAADIAAPRGPGPPGGSRAKALGAARGPIAIILGMVAFGAGCFLPYYGISSSPGTDSTSLWQSFFHERHAAFARLGGVLFLFAAAAIIVALAIAAVRRPQPWTRPALLFTAGAWAITWVGSLTSDAVPGGHRAGYWVIVVGVIAVLVGTVLLWVEGPPSMRGPASPDAA
jgi:hypothetical protein